MARFVALLVLVLTLVCPWREAHAADQAARLVELAKSVGLADFLGQRAQWDAQYEMSSDEALILVDLGFAAERVLGALPDLTAPFCRAHHLQIRAAQAEERGGEREFELWTTFFSLTPKSSAPFLSADITYSQATGRALLLTFTVQDEALGHMNEYFAGRLGKAVAVLPIKTDFRGQAYPELRHPGYCLVRQGRGEELLQYHFPLPDDPSVGLSLFTLVFTDAFEEYLERAEAQKPDDADELHDGCRAWVRQLDEVYAQAELDDGLRASSGDLSEDLEGQWRAVGEDQGLELRLETDPPVAIPPSGRMFELTNLRRDGDNALLAETPGGIALRLERSFDPILPGRFHLVVFTTQGEDTRRAEYYH